MIRKKSVLTNFAAQIESLAGRVSVGDGRARLSFNKKSRRDFLWR